jgi:hypothetical protein
VNYSFARAFKVRCRIRGDLDVGSPWSRDASVGDLQLTIAAVSVRTRASCQPGTRLLGRCGLPAPHCSVSRNHQARCRVSDRTCRRPDPSRCQGCVPEAAPRWVLETFSSVMLSSQLAAPFLSSVARRCLAPGSLPIPNGPTPRCPKLLAQIAERSFGGYQHRE